MNGRSTTYGDEGQSFFRRLADLGGDFADWLADGRGTLFTGLRPALPRLMAGRPEIARQLYRGIFSFAGRSVECQPAQVFSAVAPDEAWAATLNGFSWLAHLEAPGLELYRGFARALLRNWQASPRRSSFEASTQRLMSLSRHASFLTGGASDDYLAEFLRLVGREARLVAGLRPRTPLEQAQQALALLTAALAFRSGGSFRSDAVARCATLIPTIILADGGCFDRSPKTLIELLADLVPLRDALEAQRLAIPQPLNAALERALPMLRMLCHGDAGLAVFHGVEHTSAGLAKAILARDRSAGKPPAQAPQSGYARLMQGATLVIADVGPKALCDSALAFEFSDGAQRIVGSCGVPANASAAWQAAAQSAAAHSTLQIDDGPSRKIQSYFQRRTRRRNQAQVKAELMVSASGALLKASSTAHQASWGLTHARELFLAAGGNDLRGEDRFDMIDAREADGPEAGFAIRFHLHPAVKASSDRKGSTVMLLLPNKEAWAFSARGGAMTLEESIYLPGGSGPRRSWQIVIRGRAGTLTRINWAFRKLDARPRPAESENTAPRLPF